MFADIYCNYTYICLFTSFGVTLNVSVAITPLGAAGLLGLCATPSGGTPYTGQLTSTPVGGKRLY